MTDVEIANMVERHIASYPAPAPVIGLILEQWQQIIAALRRSEPVLGECEECGHTIVTPLKRLPERQPESDKVLKSLAENRCYACGWPLAGSATEGCAPFNCSYRPAQGSPEHDAWLKRVHEMARMLAAAEAEEGKT